MTEIPAHLLRAKPTPPTPDSVINYATSGGIHIESGPMGILLGHIDSPQYAHQIPNTNINHGWKIHGDLVADLSLEEAYAKVGLETVNGQAKIVDQKLYDSFMTRVSNVGIDINNTPQDIHEFVDSFIISKKRVEIPNPNGNLALFKSVHNDPLDTLSLMEVFHENETQYKASRLYREGRSFTGYTQTIENRDKLVEALETRLGDRLDDVDPIILGGHQTEGATQLSKKITGRFTTEYTDIPEIGSPMDWNSQHPKGLKGQAAIDNVLATNPEMRPYIHTGVIDDKTAEYLEKLTTDFPIFNEMLHGQAGYVSPYGTIADSFAQQGYDYKTGLPKATSKPTPTTATTTIKPQPTQKVQPAPAQPTPTQPARIQPKPTPAVVAEDNATKVIPLANEYDVGGTAAKVVQNKPIRQTPPPRSPTPKKQLPGTQVQAKKTPTPHGTKVQPDIEDLHLLSDEEKLAKSGLEKGEESISKVGARIASDAKDVDMTAAQAIREMGGKMSTFRRGGGKILSTDGGKALSEAVTQGIKGSKNLRLAALGAAVGIGAYGASRVAHRNNNSDLQR